MDWWKWICMIMRCIYSMVSALLSSISHSLTADAWNLTGNCLCRAVKIVNDIVVISLYNVSTVVKIMQIRPRIYKLIEMQVVHFFYAKFRNIWHMTYTLLPLAIAKLWMLKYSPVFGPSCTVSKGGWNCCILQCNPEWPLVWKTWKCQGIGNVREMSGMLLTVREMSGKKSCHGKGSQNCSLLNAYLRSYGYLVAVLATVYLNISISFKNSA